MNSYEYIEEVKRTNGLDTDYKVAKMLNWPQNKITQYRNGQSMDNEAARQIADLLKVPLMQVIADMESQRQKDPSKKKAWKMLAKLAKEKGTASPSLLILLGFFSWVGQYCILCKI
jgi:hypothetical protein